ncbi:hypothetical protein OsJ_04033 [Oryza sativa Japonica Group]|uniref:Pentatricopeptide repeat-containing protein n=2 Tax=Oryza TaxID=4527 RepID=B9EUC9_ORYSJ|nr:hypothetical protein OsJ_04033 [Oryza sativa Japonica Group]
MPLLGVAPNEVTYTALMHGYFIHGQRENGLSLFEEMRIEEGWSRAKPLHLKLLDRRVAWQAVGYRQAIGNDAEGQYSSEINIITYSLLVDGYGKAGKMSNALHFFSLMKAASFQPRRELIQGSEVDHGNEAEGFGSKFRKEAEALLDDMVRAGLQTSEPICQFTECQGKIERFY